MDEGSQLLTWLFFVEPLGEGKSRLISRYRCATSDDLGSQLRFGPAFLEPIGFAMDRRMLLGVKARAETRRAEPSLRSFARRRHAEVPQSRHADGRSR